ncbi:hypothetical protein Dimus_027826 [Dionaea muscipula]
MLSMLSMGCLLTAEPLSSFTCRTETSILLSPMATGTAGSLNMKFLNSELNRIRICAPCCSRSWSRGSLQRHGSLAFRQRSLRSLAVSSSPSLGRAEPVNLVEEGDERNYSALASQLAPNAHEVESLITELCNTTSIVELELKLHGFRLYVMRDLTTRNSEPPAAPSSAPAVVNTVVESGSSNGAVSTSLAIFKPAASEVSIERLLDNAADEGLAIIKCPRVGYFRRSRTIKGNRAPPSCFEKELVKEGQVLCYIEQLGGQFPVESSVAGEVVKILREDGEPVGYGDPMVAILPSFPGIKKLQLNE